jgi:hypothetical protein
MSHTESTGNAEKRMNLSDLKEFTQCSLWTLAREASGREKIESGKGERMRDGMEWNTARGASIVEGIC